MDTIVFGPVRSCRIVNLFSEIQFAIFELLLFSIKNVFFLDILTIINSICAFIGSFFSITHHT
jgi:hypothetical protein